MPVNIEIKAALRDWSQAQATARRLSGVEPEIIEQHDVFFQTSSQRLKLRIFPSSAGELILYDRPDLAGAKASRYVIARTPDPAALQHILAATLGEAGSVSKTRLLYLIGQTRVHLDEVQGLGHFLEFEVVLRDGQPEDEGHRIAAELRAEFGIEDSDLIQVAYIDLLRRANEAL